MNYRSLFFATGRTIALYLSGFFIPLLGQVLVLFTPVPLILAYVRDNRATGLAALVAATALIALFGGWYMAAFFILSFGTMSIGVGEGMLKRIRPERVALLGGLLPATVLIVVLLVYFIHVGKNPIAVAEEYLRNSMAEAGKIYAQLGLTEMAATIAAISDTFIHYLVRLLPGIFIATTVAQAAFCYGIARAVIVRKQGAEQAQTSLAHWYAPDSWVWGLIASLALLAVPDDTIKLIGWNLTILFGTLYLAQGTALVDYFLRKIRIGAVGRAVVLTIIMVLPPLIACVIALGVVDIWADLRKVREPAQTP